MVFYYVYNFSVISVKSPTSDRWWSDNVFISGGNPHLTSRFCRVVLGPTTISNNINFISITHAVLLFLKLSISLVHVISFPVELIFVIAIVSCQREWAEAKKELQEERENVRRLALDRDQTMKNSLRQVEDMSKELTNALGALASAESRAAVAEVFFSLLAFVCFIFIIIYCSSCIETH